MSLPSGVRLGVYEIVAPLGAGGMGEVFRATDTKLKRQVAIKILPPSVAAEQKCHRHVSCAIERCHTLSRRSQGNGPRSSH
ncbi:MAG: hypothetical protein ACT4QD_06885 [Acidobacteriota bacterium]